MKNKYLLPWQKQNNKEFNLLGDNDEEGQFSYVRKEFGKSYLREEYCVIRLWKLYGKWQHTYSAYHVNGDLHKGFTSLEEAKKRCR